VDNPKFPHRIAMNALPHIDTFGDDGYTKEETKMVNETKKILGDASIKITATCVRVPVLGGHSEAVNVEFERPCDPASVRRLLAQAPGVIVVDEPQRARYPLPLDAHDRDEVFVGRIRTDPTVPSGINMWVVSDNLRKGAATNAVQIAELLKNRNETLTTSTHRG
jgi:aspartate-semialdehyde dehydrogenase